MGRAPCCDKANVKKGPWSPEEDAKLKAYMDENGSGGNWIALPQKIGLKRCGKSCRLRWLNYLRPNIKHGGFSEEEDDIICSLYISIGSRWSIIAAQLPGRTDNDIKNYWNTRLKKKFLGKQCREKQAKGRKQIISTASISNNTDIFQHHPRVSYGPLQLPPIPYSKHEPRDHTASIRKLLIQLGGRFSDNQINIHDEQQLLSVGHDTQYQSSLVQPPASVYDPSIDHFGYSPQMPNLVSDATKFDMSATMLHGRVDLHENAEKLQGLDQLFFDDTITSGIHWGEMNSLVFE